jgi:hypothetical protein
MNAYSTEFRKQKNTDKSQRNLIENERKINMRTHVKIIYYGSIRLETPRSPIINIYNKSQLLIVSKTSLRIQT